MHHFKSFNKNSCQLSIHPWRNPLILGLFLCLFPHFIYAQQVIIYVKSGESLDGELLSITASEVTFDPEGEVTFRKLNFTQVDSIVSKENPPKRIFPAAQDKVFNLPIRRKRAPKQFLGIESSYCGSFFGGYRRPITILKINFPDIYGNPVPFTMRLRDGSGYGGRIGAFFPVARSGIAFGVELEVCSIDADWEVLQYDEIIDIYDGSVFIFDANIGVKFPLGGRDSRLFLTPKLGVGLRTISADSDTIIIEENHEAYSAGVQLELLVVPQFSLSSEVKVWNSDLEDYFWWDIPRYTALEFRGGMNIYLH